MKTVSLLELRNQLTKVVEEVSTGISYSITRYGEPIAILAPPGGSTLQPTTETRTSSTSQPQMDPPLATSPTARPAPEKTPQRMSRDQILNAMNSKGKRNA